MGGSQSQSQRQDQYSDTATVREVTGTQPYQNAFWAGLGPLAQIYNQRVNAPMGLQAAPTSIYSNTFDPIVQNAISKGIQGIKAQGTTQGRQTANALNVAGTGSNSALLNVLNRQNAISGGATGNQLYGMGLEQQRSQDLAREQARLAANQGILAARGQGISELSGGMTLLEAIQKMAQTVAGSRQRTISTGYGSGEARGSKSLV